MSTPISTTPSTIYSQPGFSNKHLDFDRGMTLVENVLSLGAMIPFIGSPFALIKMKVGFVQMISATAFALYAISYAGSKDLEKRDIHKQAIEHIGHGAVNILTGLIEAIPVIGTVTGIVRLIKNGGPSLFDAEGQGGKFYAYSRLQTTSPRCL
jgi:hypothetical protein